MSDLRIAIVLGSIRPGRKGQAVAEWVRAAAAARSGAAYELIDLADYPLPRVDEAGAPGSDQGGEATKAWASAVSSFDGFIFVTPEYNHSTTGVLKNAIDCLHGEWGNKAAAFVSYGTHGGARAIAHLRDAASQLQIAHVSQQLAFSLDTEFAPNPSHRSALEVLFDQLESWAGALRTVRAAA